MCCVYTCADAISRLILTLNSQAYSRFRNKYAHNLMTSLKQNNTPVKLEGLSRGVSNSLPTHFANSVTCNSSELIAIKSQNIVGRLLLSFCLKSHESRPRPHVSRTHD